MRGQSEIRFLPHAGRRLAYEVRGDGPPLVVPAWWVSHLELDWQSAEFRRFWDSIAEGYTLIRYDRLGVGMSDRTLRATDLTIDAEVATLSALFDELGLKSASLLGGLCGTCTAIAFAAAFPERVDRGVAELVLTEPDAAMRRKLVRRLDRYGRVAHIVDASAERLPLPDASVDTVVSTLVLCTVPNPVRTLGEITRVLRPGGQLLFIEHVRANSRLLAACQDRLARPWHGFAAGCWCNRPTVELMRANGFAVVADDGVWRGMPAIVQPLVVGAASR
jgi:SAM-dependent methyltransferase